MSVMYLIRLQSKQQQSSEEKILEYMKLWIRINSIPANMRTR